MSKKLKIVELGDKILRTKARAVSVKVLKDQKFQNFIDDLIKTCDLNSGVGIAAPQVNHGIRLFILWSRVNKRYKNIPKLGPIAIVNPRIISASKRMVKGYEGCLSIPGIRGIVPRHETVDVEFITRDGEKLQMTLEKFPARIFQHEFDHLNGIVFLDRADSKSLITEKEYKRIIQKSKSKAQK